MDHPPVMVRSRSTALLVRAAVVCSLLASPILAADGGAPRYHERQAVVLSVTEEDLNHILDGIVRSQGGPVFHGSKDEVSRGISDMSYEAEVTPPQLRLAADGAARLIFDIRHADLTIGAIEKRIAGRQTRCEEAGLRIDPELPLDVDVALRFEVRDGDLRIVPEQVLVADPKKSVRLVKPSKCRNSLLPRWLLWWAGKPLLRRRLSDLDDRLLAAAQREAGQLNEGDGFLRERWTLDDKTDGAKTRELFLYPASIETGQGALTIGFDASVSDPAASGDVVAPVSRSESTHIAISQRFLNEAVELFFARASAGEPRRVGGNVSRLIRSRSIYTLVPGLRELETTEGVTFELHLGSPPTIEIDEVPGTDAQALLRLRFSGLEIRLIDVQEQGEQLLGAVRVDEAIIGVAPVPSPLGGLSLDVLQNEWQVSSSGIDFNEPLFRGLLQELIFGEGFETQYAPLAVDLFDVGAAGFGAVGVRSRDGYLVVELAPRPTEPGYSPEVAVTTSGDGDDADPTDMSQANK